MEDKKTDEVAEQLSVGFYDNVRKGSSARLRMGNCQEGGVRTHDVGVPTPESRLPGRSGQGPHALRPGGAAVHFSVTKPKVGTCPSVKYTWKDSVLFKI